MAPILNSFTGSKGNKEIVQRQEARLAEQDKAIAAQEEASRKREAAQRRASRMRSSREASLITGLETGVTKTTLG